MTPSAYIALQKKKWESEGEKYLVVASIWSPFTGDVTVTDAIGNKVADQVHQSVISEKKFSAEEHSYSTTIPMIERLYGKVLGGKQKARGSEIRPKVLNKTVFYNVERTAVAVEDESVEGETIKWTQIGNKAANLLKDRLVETTDWRIHKSIIEVDPLLSEAEYWTNSSIAAPVTKAINSRFFVNSKAPITWDGTYSTYEGTINTAADALTTGAVFDQAAAENVVSIASRVIDPIRSDKLSGFNYVTLLSDVQYEQLTGGASNAFMQMFRDGGERAKDNIGITSDLGVWRGHLWMKNVRAPIFNIAGASGSKFEYLDPELEAQSLARVAPGSGTGTCELAITLGKNAIGKVNAGGYKLEKDFFDYKFESGMCYTIKHGFNRMEFLGSDTAAKPYNKGSFVYMTASKDTVGVL